MLISPKHKFIFIHVPKNGGSSVQAALKSKCHPMCNLQGTRLHRYSKKFFGENRILCNFRKHIPLYDLKKRLGSDFEKYTVWAIKRNPYDRAVSNFHFIKKTPHHEYYNLFNEFGDFKTYCKNLKKLRWKDLQSYYLKVDDKIAVDHLVSFERLNEEWDQLMLTFDLETVHLPKENSTPREKPRYLDYYDADSLKIINEVYEEDFRLLGYETLS